MKPDAENAYRELMNTGELGFVRRDGAFEIRNVPPGRYTMTVDDGPGPWTVESAMVGGIDVLDSAIEVGHEDVQGVVLTFTDVMSEISGIVTRRGRPAAQYELIAFPTDRAVSSRRIQMTRSDTAGRYTLKGLPPGKYALAHVPPVRTDWQLTPQSLSRMTRLAAIAVTRGGRHTLDLAVR